MIRFDRIGSDHDLISLFEHDLFGKPVPTLPDHALERCPAAKLELLHPVKLTLGKGHRIVEAQRTER